MAKAQRQKVLVCDTSRLVDGVTRENNPTDILFIDPETCRLDRNDKIIFAKPSGACLGEATVCELLNVKLSKIGFQIGGSDELRDRLDSTSSNVIAKRMGFDDYRDLKAKVSARYGVLAILRFTNRIILSGETSFTA